MLVNRKKFNEYPFSKSISPSIDMNTSSSPREEQVSEEFIINGKRYRQIYQRRVVLERKTTRDVFFLPSSSNTDTKVELSSNQNHYEYKSPHYDERVSSMTATGEDSSTATKSTHSSNGGYVIQRPGLDLTVLHTNRNSQVNEPCLSPAIIVRSVNNNCVNSYTTSGHSNCSQCKTTNQLSSKPNDTINSTVLTTQQTDNNNTDESNINVSGVVKRSNSRARSIVRNLSNSIKRSLSTGIQNTRGLVKPMPNKSKDPESITGNNHQSSKSMINHHDLLSINTLKQDEQQLNNTAELIEPKSKQIMGYMYKFGVWDDQQPVLDPRLPVFLNPSVNANDANLTGTVIPTAPEWHHEEVGLENIEKFQGAYVRGRTVACLQRFTQHSLASGKALHRSTYVQQTRLVRQ
ncbi:unnamed protein product, partial [Schistosoma turkestanicum]